MATSADATMAREAGQVASSGAETTLPPIVARDQRPTRGEALPRHLHRYVSMASRITILSGFTPPEPEAYSQPGGQALFDLVFRAGVKQFASEPPQVVPVQDMPVVVGGLPPLRLDLFDRDFSDEQSTNTLALAIEVRTSLWSVFVPIAPGIAEETAKEIVDGLVGREGDFIDMETLELHMRAEGDEARSLDCRWVIAPPGDLGKWFSDQNINPAGLMLLRRPGSWDRYRAEFANLAPHWMPPFSAEAFEKAMEDGLTADPDRLDELYQKILVLLHTLPAHTEARWEVEIDAICALLAPLGRQRPDRMGVVVTVARYEATLDGTPAEIGREVVCVGVALDLHQACALHAAVGEDPAAFVAIQHGEEWFEVAIEPQMVPAAVLSRLGATIDRRLADGYESFSAVVNASDSERRAAG